jgi:hypothetical protein
MAAAQSLYALGGLVHGSELLGLEAFDWVFLVGWLRSSATVDAEAINRGPMVGGLEVR